MNYTQKTAGSVLAALLSMAAPQAFGQTAPAAEPSLDAEDEAIVLSPFVISATEDVGSYQATSTLAGTRLRTDLKDVGSSISVVTSQFLQDTGATSSEQLLVYTAGTEVGGSQGNFSGVGDGRQLGEGDRLVRPNGNTRVRGLTAADNTRDFFLTEIPWDSYNVGRVDLQRGPNAILFGMGSPAGIINSSLDQASFRDSNKVEVRFDNEGSVRGSMNLNKVLLKNELALRVAALADRTNYRQDPAFNHDDRIYAALRYDPAFLKKNGMATSFRVNYEDGSIHSNRPRSLTPGDQITPWLTTLNKQTFDPRQAWAVDGTGVTSVNLRDGTPNPNYNPLIGAYGNVYGNVLSIFNYGSAEQNAFRTIETTGGWGLTADGTVDGGIAGEPFARPVGVSTYADYMTKLGSPYASLNAYKDVRLGDSGVGLFDFYNTLLDGPNKREWRGFEAANVSLSQTFLNNRVGIEAVYDKQKYRDGQTNGVDQVIYVDINSHYLDGTPNPYVGQAFVQSNNSGNTYNSETEAKRVTAFADLRTADVWGRNLLTRILGRHVFTGMYAEEEKKSESRTFSLYAMPQSYVLDAAGPDASKWYTLDSNERNVTRISYLSGDLRSASSATIGGISTQQNPVSTNSIYRYNSRWARSTNPADANYVDPAAPWTPPPTREGAIQADNPENYYGWGTYNVAPFLAYNNGDIDQLYRQGNKAYRDVQSQAFVWQSYWFDETIVPVIGWRKDEYRGGNREAPLNAAKQIDGSKAWTYNDSNASSGESVSYSVVAHTPSFIREKLPFGSTLSLFINKSENFQPMPGEVDMFGNALANPSGETKDYGFVVSVLDERLSLKVNWYETNVENDRLRGFEFWRVAQWSTILMQNAVRVKEKDPANDWKWSATNTNGTATQAQFDAGSAAVFEAYANNPTFKKFVDGWGFAGNLQKETPATANTPAGIAATSDTTSKGIEFELMARPTNNWNIALNVSKTKATQNNIGGALKEWIEAVETLATGPAGDLRLWWAGDSTTMRTFWDQNVGSQYKLLKLMEGRNVAELRPWRANLVTGYTFDYGFLKNVNIGGAYRWEDRQIIGFPIRSQVNPATGATEYVYDVANPYRGPTENHVDLWVGYGRKLTDKIDWRIQLNVRDIFAEKKLIPISTQPDGTPAAYRIPELTSWQITNTFSF